MPRGGKRVGAGRKSNANIAHAREMIGAVIPDTRWKEFFEKLALLVMTGSERSALEAFRILAMYAFGVPTENNSSTETEKEISVIRIIDPDDEDHDPNVH